MVFVKDEITLYCRQARWLLNVIDILRCIELIRVMVVTILLDCNKGRLMCDVMAESQLQYKTFN